MCLAIPGKVIEIKDNGECVVDYDGETREASIPKKDINVGDYVIVSQKIVIKKLDEKVAKETLEYIKENVGR
jgi:hydrogenase expression/formation protein HypC